MSGNKPAVSFDEIIQQGRKKREAERLAQEIFGKRRVSAQLPGPKAAGGSLASRVGINKRSNSLPRAATPRLARTPVHAEKPRPRPSRLQSAQAVVESNKSQQVADDVNGGDGLYIRGAARTAFTVVASNFAPGTTAADIESVMESVGGAMSRCALTASNPTVIAEMDFQDKSGADKVVETFNGKKADGRTLYVYMKASSGAKQFTGPAVPPTSEPSAPIAAAATDVVMEVDENAESRETQDRIREQRRGRDDREVLPTGPRGGNRNGYDQYYDQGPRQTGYRDPRYGFGGGNYGGARGGRYYDDGGRYGRGGQSWR